MAQSLLHGLQELRLLATNRLFLLRLSYAQPHFAAETIGANAD